MRVRLTRFTADLPGIVRAIQRSGEKDVNFNASCRRDPNDW